MTGKAYRKSKLWKLAIELVTAIHTLSDKLPQSAKGSVGFAIGRAGMALPAGFAAAHGNPDATCKACEDCLTTLRELDTHLIVARRINALSWWQCREVRHWMRRLERCATEAIEQLDAPIEAELDEPFEETDEPQRTGVIARLFPGRRDAA